MKKSTLLWIIGAAVVIGGLVLLKAKGVIGKIEARKVAVDTVSTKTIIESVSASGKIYPVTEVKISPDISGEVLELFVEEGQTVQKGQLLARIDASLYQPTVSRANAAVNQSKTGTSNAQAQLKQLEIQLQAARTTLMRNKKLFDDKVISAIEYEQAETAYKAAQASIEATRESIRGTMYNTEAAVASLSEANQNIRRANVYAPMSGIVSRLGIKQGERVVGTAQMAGTDMLRIADMSLMKVDVEIGENDIQKISIGDTAIVEVDAYTKRKFKGRVSKIAQSNTSNMTTQAVSSDQISNYTVSVELDPNSYSDLVTEQKFPFRPGMSASVEILTNHKYGIVAVPINAVTARDLDSNKAEDDAASTEFKEFVFVVNNKRVKLTEVTSGTQDNRNIEITSGLKVGDVVVVAPYTAVANYLKDNDEVMVVPRSELFSDANQASAED